MRSALVVVLCLAVLGGCAHVDVARFSTAEVVRDPDRVTLHWQGLPLASGQILINEKPTASTLFISLIGAEPKPFVHAGIIAIEQGEAWVYEAMGIAMPRLSGRPNERMRGGIRRVRFASFIGRGGIMAIHEPPAGTDPQRLVDFARLHAARRTGFDGYFDARDAERFYCIEFIARGIEAAGGPTPSFTAVQRHDSLDVALKWLRIDAPQLWLASDVVDPQRRIALLSPTLTAAQINAWFAMRQELHRRFTPALRLGALFEWRMQSIHYRPAVARYLDAGLAAALAEPERWLRDAAGLAALHAEREFGAPSPSQHWTAAQR